MRQKNDVSFSTFDFVCDVPAINHGKISECVQVDIVEAVVFLGRAGMSRCLLITNVTGSV